MLNGGGAWPGGDKHASQADWLKLADAYWAASKEGNTAGVPAIWGIDAVHGNSNIFGATLFPHNIGLGAAHDPCLIRDVQAATARQVRATGQDWAFAPTLAVVRDDRWGRTYEGFSEDPRITRAYGYEAIRGLQGSSRHGIGSDGVIGTAKHFIGDGGTAGGKDQGVNPSSEAEMINMHGQGYYGALAAGSQSVMVSFNSWTNPELGIAEGKLHGSRKALTEILKGKMGFDGLVVSDWNGIGQVAGCTNASCPQAINAGMDVVMVPQDWKAFIANTLAQVRSGADPDGADRRRRHADPAREAAHRPDGPAQAVRARARDRRLGAPGARAGPRARCASRRCCSRTRRAAAAAAVLEGAGGRQERRLAPEPDGRLEPHLAGHRQHQRRLPERHLDPRRPAQRARRRAT